VTEGIEGLRESRDGRKGAKQVVAPANKRFNAVFLLAIGLAPLLWFRRGIPVLGVDSFFHLHPQGLGVVSYSAWDATMTPGVPAINNSAYLNTIQALLTSVMPVYLEQAVILTTLALASTMGMFFAASALIDNVVHAEHRPDTVAVSESRNSPKLAWNDRVFRDLPALLVALAWVVNPFALSFVWWHQLLIEVTWATTPWLLLLLLRASSWPRLITICVGLLIGVAGRAAFTEPYLPEVTLVVLAVAVSAIVGTSDRPRAVRRIGIASFAVMLGTATWLIPELPLLSSNISAANTGPASAVEILRYNSLFSGPLDVLRLTHYFTLHLSMFGAAYNSWADTVLNPPGSVLAYLLPFLAVAFPFMAVQNLSDVHQRRAVVAVIGLFGCLVLAFLLSMGLSGPLASVYRESMRLPIADAFRSPADRFAIALIAPMCLLAGCTAKLMMRGHNGYLFVIGAAIIIGPILGWPWWTGAVIPKGNAVVPSGYALLPPAYNEVGTILGRAPIGGKTEILPFSTSGQTALEWQVGVQPNTNCILQDYAPNRTTLCTQTGDAVRDRVGEYLSTGVEEMDPRVLDVARIFGIDEWVVHNDWNPIFGQGSPPAEEANAFLGEEGHSQLSIWKQSTLPLLYLAKSIKAVPDWSYSSLASAAGKVASDSDPALVRDGMQSCCTARVTMNITENTPASYSGVVRFTQAGNTLLVFGNTYSADWRLNLAGNGRVLKHVMVNGYANGWLVSGSGPVNVSLLYGPGVIVKWGEWTAAGVATGSLVALAFALGRWCLLYRRRFAFLGVTVEPISLADMVARQDAAEPVSLADMVARNGHPGLPAK
jgi:hypothetical protein